MSKSDTADWVLVYLAEGRLDGEMIRSFLEAQGVPAIISQESLGSIYGLTVGDLGRAEILVAAADAKKAREVLKAMERGEFANEILVDPTAVKPLAGEQLSDQPKRKRVLFLCNGNSARSQLAEALVNHELSDQWVAYSAGVEPAGFVHPLVFKALAEEGIHFEGTSKPITLFRDQVFDRVITLCDEARESCPTWFQAGIQTHISLEDPSLITGPADERLAAFRNCIKNIRETVFPLLSKP